MVGVCSKYDDWRGIYRILVGKCGGKSWLGHVVNMMIGEGYTGFWCENVVGKSWLGNVVNMMIGEGYTGF